MQALGETEDDAPDDRNAGENGASTEEAFRSWVADTVGWLPQIDLRMPAREPDDIEADVEGDVALRARSSPLDDDVDEGDLRQALLDLCREDMHDWLSPLREHRGFPLTHEGGLLAQGLAMTMTAFLGEDPVGGDRADRVHHLSRLLRLVGRTADDAGSTGPTQVVRGDYVYLPVDLEHGLGDLFRRPAG